MPLTPTDVQHTVIAAAVETAKKQDPQHPAKTVSHYTGCNIVLVLSTLLVAMHSLHFGFTISVINTPAYVILNCDTIVVPSIGGNSSLPSNQTILDDGGSNFFKPCVPMGGMLLGFFLLSKIFWFFCSVIYIIDTLIAVHTLFKFLFPLLLFCVVFLCLYKLFNQKTTICTIDAIHSRDVDETQSLNGVLL